MVDLSTEDTCPELDLKIVSLLNEGARERAVVLVVVQAAGVRALGGVHPDVRAARVEDDVELVSGLADADFSSVLRDVSRGSWSMEFTCVFL